MKSADIPFRQGKIKRDTKQVPRINKGGERLGREARALSTNKSIKHMAKSQIESGKPKLLDLFSGAGGACKGYQRAGFYVVGVDIKPQPHYCGDEFYQADALEYVAAHGAEYDAIHASPPCQAFSAMTNGRRKDRVSSHPTLIRPVRDILSSFGKPYIIENVIGAPLDYAVLLLCGTMFGLQTQEGNQLRRHRIFEVSFPVGLTPPCQHNNGSAVGVYGGGQNPKRRKLATVGVWGHSGGHSNRDGRVFFGNDKRREAMDIDWMSGSELSEAIPPAYTAFIGAQLLAYLQRQPQ